MDTTKFKISDTKYLKIDYPNLSEECLQCFFVNISYVDEENDICVIFGNDSLEDLKDSLQESDTAKQLINGEFILDKESMGDPATEFNTDPDEETYSQELFKFHFTGNAHTGIPPYYNGWLYNDKNKNIILEISPHYPWDREKESLVSHEEFTKNFKPLVQIEIKPETMVAWGVQIDALYKSFDGSTNTCAP